MFVTRVYFQRVACLVKGLFLTVFSAFLFRNLPIQKEL